jgi:hypothetical protein
MLPNWRRLRPPNTPRGARRRSRPPWAARTPWHSTSPRRAAASSSRSSPRRSTSAVGRRRRCSSWARTRCRASWTGAIGVRHLHADHSCSAWHHASCACMHDHERTRGARQGRVLALCSSEWDERLHAWGCRTHAAALDRPLTSYPPKHTHIHTHAHTLARVVVPTIGQGRASSLATAAARSFWRRPTGRARCSALICTRTATGKSRSTATSRWSTG